MNWEAMTPEQRDKLVYSKVMGQPLEVPCTAEEDDIDAILRPEDHYQDHGWWICGVCEYRGQGEVYTHLRQLKIPHYTQSIDAAWLVVEKMSEIPTKPWQGELPPNTWFMHYFEQARLWACSAQEAAEEICKAALQAKGVDINA